MHGSKASASIKSDETKRRPEGRLSNHCSPARSFTVYPMQFDIFEVSERWFLMTNVRRLDESNARREIDPRQWVRQALEMNSTLHSGHRAMFLLIANEARNDWDRTSDVSISKSLAAKGYVSRGSIWASWYSAESQARILKISERHVRSLIDDLTNVGLITKVSRPGRTSILVFNTRVEFAQDEYPGTAPPEFDSINSRSPRNCSASSPGATDGPSPEPDFLLSNREVSRRHDVRRENELIAEVISDVTNQIRKHGRSGRQEATFVNPWSSVVIEQLGWMDLCRSSEFDLKLKVQARLRTLLRESA